MSSSQMVPWLKVDGRDQLFFRSPHASVFPSFPRFSWLGRRWPIMCKLKERVCGADWKCVSELGRHFHGQGQARKEGGQGPA
jgi:hypothetical protein